MNILVFQHVDVEHPGSFRQFWAERGATWRAVELDAGETIPELEPFDLLCVMGGPMDVWEEDAHPWLKPEKAAIRRWVRELRRPYLGVCLGHQLLADALSGAVAKMARPDVGISESVLTDEGRADPLFEGLGERLETFEWHGVAVTALPEGGVTLASSPACAVEAMRVGENAYGVQFHCEIIDETVADWGRIPEYKASLVASLGQDAADGLADAVTPRLPAFAQTARIFERNLARIVEQARASA